MHRAELIAAIDDSNEVNVLNSGAVVVVTGHCTGRPPKAKFVVHDKLTNGAVD